MSEKLQTSSQNHKKQSELYVMQIQEKATEMLGLKQRHEKELKNKQTEVSKFRMQVDQLEK